MTNLSEQDREALARVLRDGRPDEAVAIVADIVRRARETAWAEGWLANNEWRQSMYAEPTEFRTHDSHSGIPRNPYRAAGDAQGPVLASNTRSVDLGDAGDVEGAQNGADDGVRGGGA